MEFNKEEARRAMEIAVKKISESDYDGAKKFADKAQTLYPNLDGLKQVLTMSTDYISASNRGGEADWYGVLGVDPLANDEALNKQYKKLALLLHPDKNKFNDAEGAFKLVSEAWCVLSDKVKRTSYDQKRNSEEAKTEMHEQPNTHRSASNGMQKHPKIRKSSSGIRYKQPNRQKATDGNKHAFMKSSKPKRGDLIYNFI